MNNQSIWVVIFYSFLLLTPLMKSKHSQDKKHRKLKAIESINTGNSLRLLDIQV